MEFAQAAKALGLRAIHGAEVDLDGRPPPHAAVDDAARAGATSAGCSRARTRTRATRRGARATRRRVHAGRRRGARRRARLPERLRAPGRARRADAAPAAAPRSGATRLRVELQRPFQRHDRALQPRAGGARASGSGVAARGDRQRPRARARARAAAGRVRRAPRAHDARRLRAAAARQPRARARLAGRRWPRASRTIPRRWPRPRALAERAALRPHQRPRLPLPGRRGRRRRTATLAELCWSLIRRALPARAPATAATAHARLEEELRVIDALGLSGFFLLHRDLLELAREVAVEVRGPDTARALLPPGRGRGSSVSSIVCYLTGLSHVDPVANELLPRALPQRGAHRAAGHRPRLPARHPRGADPARARALRARALGAGRGVPDVPLARRDPRARQGARPAAGRDRARRARGGAVGGARRDGRRRVGARAGAGGPPAPLVDPDSRAAVRDVDRRVAGDGQRPAARPHGGAARRRGAPRRAARPLGVAGAAVRRGLRAAAPPLPALGRDDRLDPAAGRLLPGACRRRWRAARCASGTRTPARTRAS